ncbi:MAG: dihydroorotate dehydrogenase electron transfer subunit [Bacilli bacterium]
MIKTNLTVIEHELIAHNIYSIQLKSEKDLHFVPGEFVHIRVGNGIDPLLRRPISVCDYDIENFILTCIYRAEGHGTTLLSKRIVGEQVDILGPLGQGFPYTGRKKGDHALLVGGGIGVPPLFFLAKELVAIGVKVTTVIGFESEKHVFFEKEFADFGSCYVTTVDGSYGTKGFVTDVLKQQRADEWDAFYSCGPTPMLKAMQQTFDNQSIDGYVSLEQRMGCGVGACLACVCAISEVAETTKKYYKICSDGPVFPYKEVVI